MPDLNGFVYDDTDCELFCWHVGEIADTIAKMRAHFGDAYIETYIAHLCDVIRLRTGIIRQRDVVPD